MYVLMVVCWNGAMSYRTIKIDPISWKNMPLQNHIWIDRMILALFMLVSIRSFCDAQLLHPKQKSNVY